MEIKRTYCVIERSGQREFVEAVEASIMQGWKCQGGISTIREARVLSYSYIIYCQAMVKEEGK